MSGFLRTLGVLLSSTLFSIPYTATAQIQNGDFESRNAVPTTQENVGPSRTRNGTVYQDDLQAWDSTPVRTASGLSGPGAPTTIVTDYTNIPSYLSTDGTGSGNIAVFGVAPHSGNSSVLIKQHDQDGDHNYDQFLTQQLAAPLIAGHRYKVNFWAIKPQPGAEFRTKLALYVTDAAPVYDLVYSSATQYTLLPSPGSKMVISDDIQANQGWVLVSGFIDIPDGQTTNQWVTVGYARANQYRDTSIPNTLPNVSINYLIDDVSLQDMGCSAPTPGPITGNNDYAAGRHTAEIDPVPGATSYNWYRGGVLNTTNHGTSAIWTIPRNGCGGTDVSVEAVYACGKSAKRTQYFPAENCGTRARTAYPSPASESLAMPEGTEDATILNAQGKPLLQLGGARSFDVRHLPDGLYNLQMRQNGKLVNQRIEIKH